MAISNMANELGRLQKECEDWQRAYQEEKDEQFNVIINKKCLHCGKEMALYCEKCHQELITKNAELQLENEELQEEIMENDLKVIGAEEYTEASMREIIENYYTANEDCVPKKTIRDKLKELEELEKSNWFCLVEKAYNNGKKALLRELLGEVNK